MSSWSVAGWRDAISPVAAVAVLAGVGAACSSVSPTGQQPFDAIVLVVVVGVATWLGARSPWWLVTGVAGGAAALAYHPAGVALGVAGAMVGLGCGWNRRVPDAAAAVGAGFTLNALGWIRADLPFGATTVIGVGAALVLAGFGLVAHDSATRRVVARGAAAVAFAAALASLGVWGASRGATGDVAAGRDLVERGVRELRDGEYERAAESFDEAAEWFGAVERAMNRPWAQPARLVPVVSQHRRIAAVVGAEAADASNALAAAARVFDPDLLRVVDGRVDLDEIEAVEGPLTDAADALFDLRAAIDDVDSGWVLSRYERQLDAARDEFDDQGGQLEVAVDLLGVLPDLLGGEGERAYFVAFTTPAEARGLGGFMGNYAIVTADDGELEMAEFGRTGDLNDQVEPGARLDLPGDWNGRWGRFGFSSGPDGTVGSTPWSNVSLSPHFPSTASVIAELYAASGGRPVDGVLALDAFVLEALLEFTGPIEVGVGEPYQQRITENNASQFLLFDQYLIPETTDRVDLLDEVASQVVEQLLAGAVPSPALLADRLGPLLDERRLVVWMADDTEQSFIADVDAHGGLPDASATDGLYVVINNAGANKLDAFLDRGVDYRAEFDPATGAVDATVAVTLRSDAPTEGLPDGVIGNYVGDPIGTNRMFVSVYTALPVTGAALDDEPVGFEPGTEAGWYTAMVELVVPAGDERVLSVQVGGQLVDPDTAADDRRAADRYALVVGTQPLVDDVEHRIDARDADGGELVGVDGVLTGWQRWVFDADGALVDAPG